MGSFPPECIDGQLVGIGCKDAGSGGNFHLCPLPEVKDPFSTPNPMAGDAGGTGFSRRMWAPRLPRMRIDRPGTAEANGDDNEERLLGPVF